MVREWQTAVSERNLHNRSVLYPYAPQAGASGVSATRRERGKSGVTVESETMTERHAACGVNAARSPSRPFVLLSGLNVKGTGRD